MKYQLLIFDADETLFDFKGSEEYALERSLTRMGVDYNKKYHLSVYKEVNSKIWQELDEGKIELKRLKIERFRRYFDRIQKNFDPYEFANIYMDNLGDASILLEGATELLVKLENEVEMIIITNGLSKVQDKRIKKSTISGYFKEIIVSEEVGVSKPNPKIFEIALSNFKEIEKDKILMIGDNISSDILGGINFGIDTCWYNPQGKEGVEGINPTYEVKNFNELLELVL